MIDMTNRPELAKLDAIINTIDLNNAARQNDVNLILSDYPTVWDALIEGIEPSDEDLLASQAVAAAERISSEAR